MTTIAITIAIVAVIGMLVWLAKQQLDASRESERAMARICLDQQEFISRNITERVVHLNPGEPYVPMSTAKEADDDVPDMEFEELTPEGLAEIKQREGKNNTL
jgi:hypothetical protein